MKHLSTLLLATFLGPVAHAQEITILNTPPTDQRNNHYLSNRPPLQASPFAKLPIGAIQPGGWLKKQLELQADGLCGHLPEVSEFCEEQGNAWLSKDQKGHGEWEEVPYWLKGFVDLGNVLHDSRIQAESKKWLDAVLASQRADGWFGPIANLKSTRRDAEDTGTKSLGLPDLWANALMLSALRSHFEATQDRRIIPFMLKYYDWVLALPDKEYLVYWVDKRRGVEHLRNILWLYNATGEKRLLTLAEKAHRCGHDWTSGISRFHNVDFAECFIEPGLFSMLSKKKSDLDAVERNRNLIYEPYGQVPGGMFGGDEKMRPGYGDPRQAVETCGMVEMMQSCEAMFTHVDGDIRWADRCEDVAFNSYPAALTADMRALRYLTAPNMAVSDHVSKKGDLDNAGAMFLMNPSNHRCCQHNHAQGWPYYTEHLWLATPDNGLCAMLYSQSSVSAKVANGQTVSIVEDSRYPFADTVSFKVSTSDPPVKFPLYLRVPGWCTAAQLSVNGTRLKASAKPGQYIRLEREWQDGDRLELKLPMQTTVRTWVKNKDSVSVDRGPLTYSLQIKERYEKAPMATKKSKGGWPPMGKPGWPAFEIFPESPWNYGLVVEKGFQWTERPWPADDMPWTQAGAPVMITASAKLIPEWELKKNNLIGLLMPSPVMSAEPLTEVTLLPMGACRLRLSAFPTIADGPAAPAQENP